MAGGSHTFVRPARLYFHSTELATNVRRTFGYQGYCSCGWEGSLRHEHGHAQDDVKRHRRQPH